MALAAFCLVSAVGCSSDDGAKNAAKAAATSSEDRIKQIQNTPGMSDEDKARVIAQIQTPPAPAAH